MKFILLIMLLLSIGYSQDVPRGIRDNDGLNKFERIGINEVLIKKLEKRVAKLEKEIKKMKAEKEKSEEMKKDDKK